MRTRSALRGCMRIRGGRIQGQGRRSLSFGQLTVALMVVFGLAALLQVHLRQQRAHALPT